MTSAGLGVKGRTPLSAIQRRDIIFQYSVEETFYRSPGLVKHAFDAHGLSADFNSILLKRLEQKIARSSSMGAMFWRLASRVLPVAWVYTTFKEAIVIGSAKGCAICRKC
jgi:hypothetical protein